MTITDASAFVATEYDYIIVGGGTAGLVLAARLSEDGNKNVAVLEAGIDHSEQPIVNTPGMHIGAFGHPDLDWRFQTVPQKDAAGKVHGCTRGKGLGGSSAINFSMFSQASRADLDNWAACGNDRWSFDQLMPFYRKSETYHAPSAAMAEAYSAAYVDPKLRGTDGPIQVSFAEREIGWLAQVWPQTCLNLGYNVPQDPRTGSALGGFNQLTCADPTTATRSYSASAYYRPNKGRPNLHVLTEAMAAKVVWSADGTAQATGVEFERGGQTFTARLKAQGEVILSAGTIQSPQLLEVSGVGNSQLLRQHGIPIRVENDRVGENLQDHLMAINSFRAAKDVPTAEAFRNPAIMQAALQAYAEHKAGPLASFATPTSFTSLAMLVDGDLAEVQRIADLADKEVPGETALLRKQFDLCKAQILDPKEAVTQNCPVPMGSDVSDVSDAKTTLEHAAFPDDPGVGVGLCLERPFSRGSVHIKSADTHDAPLIDPKYLSHEVDVEIAAAALMHIQKVFLTEPLSSKVLADATGAKVPYPGGGAWLKNLDEAREHVRGACFTQWHPCGTCAMLPKEFGGVVDQSGRVYGAKGLRVCDASVFPIIPQGNIMSLVYAVAERIADDIRKGV